MGVKFLGVSTGRSGSVWVSKVFHAAGIACTHERIFNAAKWGDGPSWNFANTLGEWSAQAVPFLGGWGGVVFHQVRHPLAVIGSYLARHTFEPPHGAEGRFIIDESGVDGPPLQAAAEFWVRWNDMIDPYADMRWQVEEFDMDTLARAASVMGVDLTHRASTERPPANIGRKRVDVSWADIAQPLRDRVKSKAEEYGY